MIFVTCPPLPQLAIVQPPSTVLSARLLREQTLCSALMSHSHVTASEPPPSDFQRLFEDALKGYEERTKKDLLFHPLSSQLQDSNSPEDILSVIFHQSNQMRPGGPEQNRRLERWLNPTVKTLFTLSRGLGPGVDLVRPSICTSLISAFSYLFGSRSHPRGQSSLDLVSSFQCVFSINRGGPL